MTGSTKAEVETIKKFLSRTNDNIRLTYRRDPSPLLRRCMIVGTTNDPRCLPNDASGNRRFLPVPCDRGRFRPKRGPTWTRHREQLWAEALHRIREKGETAYLPDSLKGAQAELTEQYRAVDEVAEEVIGDRGSPRTRSAVTANQIATGIGLDPRQPEHLPHHDRPQADELHPVKGVPWWRPEMGMDAARWASATQVLTYETYTYSAEANEGVAYAAEHGLRWAPFEVG